jgi:Uma2 family endonuclease
MARQTAARLTYDDCVKLPDDGNRYEIIDGELYVQAAPVPKHQFIVANLIFAFTAHFRAHGGGRALGAPLDIVLADDRIVQPDVVVITDDRAGIIGSKNVQGAPNLVVEVLSAGNRRYDEIQKRKVYESSGVEEYWIVDPEVELMKIYRASRGAFVLAGEIDTDTGGTITTPLLPRFAVDVREIFA